MASNDINPFPLLGKPAGVGMVQAYAITDTEHNTAHEALSDFPFTRYVRGANCIDKASDGIHCEIWLEPVGGVRDVADVNCPVYIYYAGTHIWKTVIQILGGETFISFNDGDCQTHAAPGIGNYALPAFIAALHIKVITYPTGIAQLTVAEILASATAPGGVNSGALPRSAGAPAGSVEEGLADVETDFAVEHVGGTGAHAAGFVSPAMLNIDANVHDSDENLVAGRFEEDDDDDGIGNSWLEFGAGATFSLDATHVERGALAQRVQAPGPGLGIYTIPTFPHLPADFKGYSVVAHVRVWCTNADNVYLQMFDGVATVTSPASGTAGAFSSITLRQDRDAAATNFIVRVFSVGAGDFWIDSVKVSLGVTAKAASSNPWAITYDLMKTEDAENWVMNGDFRHWTNAGAVGPPVVRYPDWWTQGVNPPTGSDQDLVNLMYGVIGWQLDMFAGESVVGDFPVPTIQPDETAYFTGYIWGNVGVSPVQIDVGIGGITSTVTIIPVIGAWTPLIIPTNSIGALGSAQTIIITVSVPAGANNFTLSGLSFNRGVIPIIFKPARPKIYKWDFNHAGVIAPGNMTFNGTFLEAVMPSPIYIHKIALYNVVAPGGVLVDTYDVLLNGGPSGLAGTITGAALNGATHIPFPGARPPIPYAQGDRLQVLMTPGAGAAADISASIEGIGY